MLGKCRVARWLLATCSCALMCIAPARGETPLSGRYVLWQKTVTSSKLPMLKAVTATSISVALVDLKQQGDRLAGSGQLCSLSLDSTSRLVRTTFPPAFLRALPPVRVDAWLERHQGQELLRSKNRTLVIGARLEDPERDRLPRDASDRRVIDQDGDGKPGMTVVVEGLVNGEVYVLQRSSSQLSGSRTKDGFSGKIAFDLEQVVVGASTALLRHGPNPQAEPGGNVFHLIRIGPSASCASAQNLARKRYH